MTSAERGRIDVKEKSVRKIDESESKQLAILLDLAFHNRNKGTARFCKVHSLPVYPCERLLQFTLIATPGRIFRHLSSGDSQEATLEAKGV